jgi:ketosteroid isomerase-like protein
MKNLLFLLLVTGLTVLRADHSGLMPLDEKVLAAVRAADDERRSAILAADEARLAAIFSDALIYTHSSGKIDSKSSYMHALVSKSTTYEKYEYLDRKFVQLTPDIVLMTSHALITSLSFTGRNENDLSILAVYRKENGHWRFAAWQSAKLPAVLPLPTPKK